MGVQASFGLRIWLMGGAVDDIENGVQALALISTSEHLFLYPHILYPSVGQSVPAERRGGALPGIKTWSVGARYVEYGV